MAAKKKAKKKVAKRPVKKRVERKPARKPGRPTKYTKALAARLCARLATGESLRKVCELKSMPSAVTVFAWIPKYPEFLKQYEEACAQRVECHVEDIIEIADDPHLQAQDKRVRIDARKWIASKLKHRKYGDKIDATIDITAKVTQIIEKTV